MLWICPALVYCSLLRYHLGLIRYRWNLKQKARRCRIPNCLFIPFAKVGLRLQAATEQSNFYCKHGQHYRRKHLYSCLVDAQEDQQDTQKREILAIIQHERSKFLATDHLRHEEEAWWISASCPCDVSHPERYCTNVLLACLTKVRC
jgi:hypothetical protein